MALDLGKQYGPLPLGAWIVAVGAGVGIMVWTRRQSTGSSSSDPSRNTEVDPGVGIGGTPGTYTQLVPVVPSTDTLEPEITTNEQWGNQAVRWLIAMGYPPNVADSAIRKYLTVDPSRTAQEYMLQSLALGRFGPPPSPLPPQEDTPSVPTPVTTPAPSTPPPVASVRTFTVTKWPLPGSSLWTIAMLMYGNPARWTDIYNANKAKIGNNPNVIHPGMVLVIP